MGTHLVREVGQEHVLNALEPIWKIQKLNGFKAAGPH
jgi:hypothetical protein